MRNEADISRSHYFDRKYLKRERFYTFIEQVELVKKFAGDEDSILEVGKGNGFVDQVLKDYLHYPVKTMDINPALQPDIIDDITRPRQVSEKSFDMVTCFEVLEHMPFEKSIEAFGEMKKIARKYILLSLPDMRYFVSLRLSVFGTLPVTLFKLFSTRRFRRKNSVFGKDHFWEIGVKVDDVHYSPGFVKDKMFRDVQVVADFRCPYVPWHHYYAVRVK